MKRWLLPLSVAPFAGLAVAQALGLDGWAPLIWASAATPWLYLPAWILLGWAIHARRPREAAVATFVVACHVIWIAPGLITETRPDAPPSAGAPLRVVTANLLRSNDRPDVLWRELMDLDADVLVLQEVSPGWLAWVEGRTARGLYPHRDVLARGDAFGIAILSRRPLLSAELVDLEGVPMIDATVDADGAPVRIFGVHTLPPMDPGYAAVWRAQLRQLGDRAAGVEGPLLVMGDLNATTHAAAFRALERAGLRDAHDALGRGLATTWPNGLFPVPPLRLDHVLASADVVPVAVREGIGAGSDHRPVVVDVTIPRAPSRDDPARGSAMTSR